MNNIDQNKSALIIYEKLLRKNEESKKWDNLCLIYQNMANTLFTLGEISKAREMYIKGITAEKKNKSPLIYIIASQLEIIRIDTMQNKLAYAAIKIDGILNKLWHWVVKYQNNNIPNECPNEELLLSSLITSLDISRLINESLSHWEKSLQATYQIEKIYQLRGDNEHTISVNQFNSNYSLIQLRKLKEAKQVLENCLAVFRQTDDSLQQAKVLSALSSVWYELDDIEQAIALQYQALALFETLSLPEDCSTAHHYLSGYFHLKDKVKLAYQHRIVELAYDIAIEDFIAIESTIDSLKIIIDDAFDKNIYNNENLPTLNDILNLPESKSLNEIIKNNNINVRKIQRKIDELIQISNDNYIKIRNMPTSIDKKEYQQLKTQLQKKINSNDIDEQWETLIALADFWEKQDNKKAIDYTYEALTIEHKMLHHPEYCSNAHNRLGIYLYKQDKTLQSAQHTLAGLTYDIAIDNWEGIEINFLNIRDFIQEPTKNIESYKLPQITDLLQLPSFYILKKFLQVNKYNLDKIQDKVNQLTKYIHKGVFLEDG